MAVVDYAALARRIFDVSVPLRAGRRVWIDSWDHSLDLASRLAWEARRRGSHVHLTVRLEELWLRAVLELPVRSLGAVPPQAAAALGETNAYIFTLGPRTPLSWDQIPEERRRGISIWLDTRYDRSAFAERWSVLARAHRVRMLGIEATLATPERASALNLGYREWREVMFGGCLVDYRSIARRARILAALLSRSDDVEIMTPHGTALRFSLGQRPVEVSDGIASQAKAVAGQVTYLPAGAVEVTALEDSAEGAVVFDAPVLVGSRRVEHLTIRLEGGHVTHFTAKEGKESFRRYLQEGTGDVDRFAFFGLGLNPNLRYGFTQDDKVLGGVTVGLGDNTGKGGRNRASGEWWASIARATVKIEGRTIMADGKLRL